MRIVARYNMIEARGATRRKRRGNRAATSPADIFLGTNKFIVTL